MREHETAGNAKGVREGLDTAVGAGFEEEERRKVALLAGQALDQAEAQTSVEGQGQAVWRGPDHMARAGAFGDVERVSLVALVIVGKALPEPLDPAVVEQVQVHVVEGQVRIRRELKQEREPRIAGGLAGDVDAIKGIRLEGIEQELLGG